jgi:hypothetical protein
MNGQDVDLTMKVSDGRMFLLSGRERIGEPNNTWISIHAVDDRSKQIDSVLVPARGEARVILRARVPTTAANGNYSGTVYFHAQQPLPGGGEGRTSVSIGVATEVHLAVGGTQRLAGVVTDVYVTDTEATYPLRVTTAFQNTGNVLARPQIDLTVNDAAGNTRGRALFADWQFDPNENRSISANWDTTGLTEGEYLANVKVSLGGESIYERGLGFQILPRGTLTRMGALEKLVVAEAPRPGTVGKVVGTFFNTGLIDSRAKFVGELYRGSTLVDAVNSEERLVPYGEKADLEMFVRVHEDGEYRLRGKVNFEGKETETKEVTFSVGSGTRAPGEFGVIAAVLVLVALIGAGTVALGRRKMLRLAAKASS